MLACLEILNDSVLAHSRGGKVFVKSIIGGIVLSTLLTPALAADQYWVEYDYSTHACSIVVKTVDDTDAVAYNPQFGTANGMPTPAPPAPIVVKRFPETAPDTANDSAAADTPRDGTANGMPTPAPLVVERPPETAPDTANDTAEADTPEGPAQDAAPAARPKDATAANATNDTSKDPIAAAWARKKAAAEAAGTADITTALIGSPLSSREEAENEMKVMRKCGIRN
jgi:hypothetical protein